jgi:hypothetical protein
MNLSPNSLRQRIEALEAIDGQSNERSPPAPGPVKDLYDAMNEVLREIGPDPARTPNESLNVQDLLDEAGAAIESLETGRLACS